MAPALGTTNRRINQILESISNAFGRSIALDYINRTQNALVTTLSENIEPSVKKPRLNHSASSRWQSSVAKSTARFLYSGRPARLFRSLAVAVDERKSPNFASWDSAQFLKRLKLFGHVDNRPEN